MSNPQTYSNPTLIPIPSKIRIPNIIPTSTKTPHTQRILNDINEENHALQMGIIPKEFLVTMPQNKTTQIQITHAQNNEQLEYKNKVTSTTNTGPVTHLQNTGPATHLQKKGPATHAQAQTGPVTHSRSQTRPDSRNINVKTRQTNPNIPKLPQSNFLMANHGNSVPQVNRAKNLSFHVSRTDTNFPTFTNNLQRTKLLTSQGQEKLFKIITFLVFLFKTIADQTKTQAKLIGTSISKITEKTANFLKQKIQINIIQGTKKKTRQNQRDENEGYNIKELLYPQETGPITEGIILKDLTQKAWKVGEPIGKGSFGEIFLASDKIEEPITSSNADYVVKIEPHTNGPLFVEIHCLLNTSKTKDDTPLPPGMPKYIASGSHYFGKTKYRFLILHRYKYDLHSLIKNCCVNPKQVLIIANQVIDILEHLHDKGYTHSDIKAENLMIGSCKTSETNSNTDSREVTEDRIFLVDFGLASKFMDAPDVHRLFFPDKKKAHNGTLEFISRDAHIGTHSRRSDLECLGYNLIYWCQGTLPWKKEELSRQPEQVHHMKRHFMTNVDRNLQQTYGRNVPKFLTEYMLYIDSLTYDERPNYEFCKQIFKTAFTSYCETNKSMVLDVNDLKQSCKEPLPNALRQKHEHLKDDLHSQISTQITKSINLATKFKTNRDTISPTIDNSQTKLLLDSGADVSLIKDKLIKGKNVDTSDTIILTGIGKGSIKTLGSLV